jgi:hypothetical protein
MRWNLDDRHSEMVIDAISGREKTLKGANLRVSAIVQSEGQDRLTISLELELKMLFSEHVYHLI